MQAIYFSGKHIYTGDFNNSSRASSREFIRVAEKYFDDLRMGMHPQGHFQLWSPDVLDDEFRRIGEMKAEEEGKPLDEVYRYEAKDRWNWLNK